MGLKDWALPDVAKLELIHPVNGPTGIFLHVLPEDSDAYRAKVIELARRRVKLGESTDPVTENVTNMDMAHELTAASIAGWSDDTAFDGAYSPERALELMKMEGLAWIREQVVGFRSERKNFFRSARGRS
jgi:hypothetical protein